MAGRMIIVRGHTPSVRYPELVARMCWNCVSTRGGRWGNTENIWSHTSHHCRKFDFLPSKSTLYKFCSIYLHGLFFCAVFHVSTFVHFFYFHFNNLSPYSLFISPVFIPLLLIFLSSSFYLAL